MLRLAAAVGFAMIAALAVIVGYPYEYHGMFLVMHDHGVSAGAATVLRIAMPLVAVTFALLAIWNVRKLFQSVA